MLRLKYGSSTEWPSLTCSRWLRIDIDFDAKNIIDFTPSAPAGSASNDLNSARCLFAPNEVLGPPTLVNGWVDELSAGVSFIESLTHTWLIHEI
jgi:hypothetical protein